MPPTSKAVTQARTYLTKRLPDQLKSCRVQALSYGTCVSQWDNLRKGDCEKEFKALKDCVVKAGKK